MRCPMSSSTEKLLDEMLIALAGHLAQLLTERPYLAV
jgi:hypothetical protein